MTELHGGDAGGPTRAGIVPEVPWEVARWSPRVHSLASQSLHGGRLLDGPTGDAGPEVWRDRDELRAALRQMADRVLSEPEQRAPITTAAFNAQRCLGDDHLDDALRHLAAAGSWRRRALGPAAAGERPKGRNLGDRSQPAVSNVWRSDMSAAAEIRAQARHPATDVEPDVPELRVEEFEVLERVEPAGAWEAGGRMDWPHRRPERAVEQPPYRQAGPVDRHR